MRAVYVESVFLPSPPDDLQFSYPEDDQTWRERETKHFSEQRDKDGNGLLSREEISVWIFPPNSDPCVNEARHLIYHADDNKVCVCVCVGGGGGGGL